MNNIFVVYDPTFECVLGAFSSYDKAQKYIDSLVFHNGENHYDIYSFVLDKEYFDA